jgi:hypothetical protein
MTSNWNDFNSADDQNSFELIPKGTLVKVRMTLKPGGHDDPDEGWTGGYATHNAATGSVYLNCEFVVLDGPYARRKLWSLIGLHSSKGPNWANMGRTFIKSILNSARNLHPQDQSPQTQQARRIDGIADLDGIEFVGKVDWEKDQYDEPKNVIKTAITLDHREYAGVMGAVAPQPASAPQQTPQQPIVNNGRPSWAV